MLKCRGGILVRMVISGLILWAGCSSQTQRPNVVLVITDDQGYGDLACHGNPMIQTPNIDRLYEECVRFTQFHVGTTCSPTRAALQTGRIGNRTGVWHTVMGRSLIRRNEVTMGDVFSANGYVTGMFGKWHLGDNYPFRPMDRGYQETLTFGGGGMGNTPDHWNNDYFGGHYRRNGTWEPNDDYCTEVWFDAALDFIRNHRDSPFFCYLATNAPHDPFNVPAQYHAMYREDKDVPDPGFYGMITHIDDQMARLLETLEELNLSENTILIFMTDNGTSGGMLRGRGYNAGMRGKKGSEYDGGHRVPFFIRWPGGGIGGGRDVPHLAAHMDALPTLIELCGLQAPAGNRFDGRSLVPLLFGTDGNWPDRTLITDTQRIEYPRKWKNSAVMTDRWRLVNGRELYDIQKDPGQQIDLESKFPDVVQQLRGDYESWWSDISPSFDESCPIVLGSDQENPAALNSHDWHGPDSPPWNQGYVRRGMRKNGYWVVDVEWAGDYEIALRRWPVESQSPLNAALPGGGYTGTDRYYDTAKVGTYGLAKDGYIPGESIPITGARVLIGDVDESMQVSGDAQEAVFRVTLPAGESTLQAWFSDDSGKSFGAYYVYVRRLE